MKNKKTPLEIAKAERHAAFKKAILEYKNENKLSWREVGEECEECGRSIRDYCLSENGRRYSSDILMSIEMSLGIKL